MREHGSVPFIVARGNGPLYDYLMRQLSGEEGVPVVVERRLGRAGGVAWRAAPSLVLTLPLVLKPTPGLAPRLFNATEE